MNWCWGNMSSFSFHISQDNVFLSGIWCQYASCIVFPSTLIKGPAPSILMAPDQITEHEMNYYELERRLLPILLQYA